MSLIYLDGRMFGKDADQILIWCYCISKGVDQMLRDHFVLFEGGDAYFIDNTPGRFYICVYMCHLHVSVPYN